jgi:hypothetical protein
MKRFGLATSLILLATLQAFAAFGYYSPISINSAQVPSTQTDFPVLVSVTDARFKTVGNGGHVQSSSGFDIRPYSDTGLTTAITGYELERYNATTGEVVMWVKVGSLSSSTTPIYLAYGDSGISTDGSSTTTWSNSFLGVYHVKDGTTLSVTDSTGSNNGTNHSATAATGQIDGCASFASASSQYVDLGTGMNPTEITYSAWAKGTSFPNAYNSVLARNHTSPTAFCTLYVKSSGKLACFVFLTSSGNYNYDGTGTTTLSTGTWYYLVMTYKGTGNILIGYVNATVDKNVTVASNDSITTTASSTNIGRDAVNTADLWNGPIDEARVASVARSADWITTEYNNQSAPGTFETLGAEAVPGANNSQFFMFFP